MVRSEFDGKVKNWYRWYGGIVKVSNKRSEISQLVLRQPKAVNGYEVDEKRSVIRRPIRNIRE
jgi:hypothetical protein